MFKFLNLLIFFFVLQAAAQTGTTVTVTIDNVSGDEGQVIFALHDESSFMKAAALNTKISEIKNGKATVTFEEVAPGSYGVISLHDKNSNEQMDMTAGGMPTEDYGVSNNPMSFGPPQWSEAKFEVGNEPVELKIRF